MKLASQLEVWVVHGKTTTVECLESRVAEQT